MRQDPEKPTVLDALNAINFVQYLNDAVNMAARSDTIEAAAGSAIQAVTQVIDERLLEIETMLQAIMNAESNGEQTP